MKKEEVLSIEEYLYSNGYKKYTNGGKSSTESSYEYIKAFYDDDKRLKYQIAYKFYDLSRASSEVFEEVYAINICIMTNFNGKTDLHTRLFNLQDVEKFAERLYLTLLNSTYLPK